MEIQQLYYYMELCKQKNFTEAGYACNMTQGALSKQIRKLENELGITLIRRNTRKFELSKEGEIFLSYAKKMTGTYEEMLKNVQKKELLFLNKKYCRFLHHIILQDWWRISEKNIQISNL